MKKTIVLPPVKVRVDARVNIRNRAVFARNVRNEILFFAFMALAAAVEKRECEALMRSKSKRYWRSEKKQEKYRHSLSTLEWAKGMGVTVRL